jgi:hypothetical protein
MENNMDYCYGKQYGLLLWKGSLRKQCAKLKVIIYDLWTGHKLWPWVLVHCLSAADSVVSFSLKFYNLHNNIWRACLFQIGKLFICFQMSEKAALLRKNL